MSSSASVPVIAVKGRVRAERELVKATAGTACSNAGHEFEI